MLQLELPAISSENQSYPQSSEQQSDSDSRVPSCNNEHMERRLQHSKTAKDV